MKRILTLCSLLFALCTHAQVNPSTLNYLSSIDDNMYMIIFDPDLAVGSQTNRVTIATLNDLWELTGSPCATDFTPTEVDSTNVDSHTFTGGFYTSSNGNVTLSLFGQINPTASGYATFSFSLPFTAEETIGTVIGNGFASNGVGNAFVDVLSGSANARLYFPDNTYTGTSYYSVTISFTTSNPDADCVIEGSGLSISGTPVANDYARFTDASTIEGRSYAEMRGDLGLVIGSDVQAYDTDLVIYAGITPSANVQSILGAANYSAVRGLLDLEAGTDFYSISAADAAFQPLDAELTAIAGLTSAADRLPYYTGSGTASLATFTSTARSLLDDASTTAMRTTLGLGSLATASTINNSNWSGTDLSVANGGTGASTLTGLLQGNGTGAITGGATINNSNWSGTDLGVTNGGTGLSAATAYAVITGGTTSTGAFQSVSGLGTSGQVLTSNGAGALPTWENNTAADLGNLEVTGGNIINPQTSVGGGVEILTQSETNARIRLKAQTDGSELGPTINLFSNTYTDVSARARDIELIAGSGAGQIRMQVGTSPSVQLEWILDDDANMGLGTESFGTNAYRVFAIANGTAPTTSPANQIQLYAEDVTSSSELKVRDEAGNVTTLSPHNFSKIPEGPSEEMAWSFYSERDGKYITVDMLKLARLIEELTGEKLVYTGKTEE